MTVAKPTKNLIVASRKSTLALWQSEWACTQIKTHHPDWRTHILGLRTQGDDITDKPLYEIGGKALFVNTLETALMDQKADIAVHSMKDVPAVLAEPFRLPCLLKRENPADAFVSNAYKRLSELPKGAVIGTSSVRRAAMILHHRPDLSIKPIRGNVPTRLAKLDAGDYDAIILALAGLIRLELAHRACEILSTDIMLPAATQGAIGIECLTQRHDLIAMLTAMTDPDTTACVTAERAMVAGLNGHCNSPIAALATLEGNTLTLTGAVANRQGTQLLKVMLQGERHASAALGQTVAEALLSKGAKALL